jgi:hypothetical protein
MDLLKLKENDVVEVERVCLPIASLVQVQLPPELRQLDQPTSAWALHHIQQQLSNHFDTLTEGIAIPVEWKEEIVNIDVVAVFIRGSSGENVRVDAVNIRQGGVEREVPLEFVCGLEEETKEKGNQEDGEHEQKAGSDGGGDDALRMARLESLVELRSTKFADGSNARRFMQRITDYLEQADPEMSWLKTFEQVLRGEEDMFKLEESYGDYFRPLDPLTFSGPTCEDTRTEKVQPAMFKQSSGGKVAYPMVPGGAATEVDETNQVKYLDLWLRHKLESEIDEGTRWFTQGLTSVVPPGVLNMFTPEELQRLLGGEFFLSDDEKLETFLEENILYKDFSEEDNSLKEDFKKAMREFSSEERESVFEFWTALRSLPPGGVENLTHQCTVQKSTVSVDHLPLATTCYNVLSIPAYESAEVMKEKLKIAYENGMAMGRA